MIRASLFKLPTLANFLVAVAVGVLLALSGKQYRNVSDKIDRWRKGAIPHAEIYKNWMRYKGLKQVAGDRLIPLQYGKVVNEAEFLITKAKILCYVLLRSDISNQRWSDRLYASDDILYGPRMPHPEESIRATWGQRCAKLIFFAPGELNRDSEAIRIKSTDPDSWEAQLEIVQYLSTRYLSNYDWFLKMEDDSYVILENLAYYLAVYNYSEPHYFGHAYEFWGSSFHTAGPGIVLSNAALRKLNNKFIKGHCTSNSGPGDVGLGRCLSEVGVEPQDTRDYMARARFLVHQPIMHLVPGKLPLTQSFWSQSKYVSNDGPDCCSDFAISFHYVPPNMMYVFEYFVYHLKPYGITSKLLVPLDINLAKTSKDPVGQLLNAQTKDKNVASVTDLGKSSQVKSVEGVLPHSESPEGVVPQVKSVKRVVSQVKPVEGAVSQVKSGDSKTAHIVYHKKTMNAAGENVVAQQVAV